MQKVQVRARVAGQEFELDARQAERLLDGVMPEPLRDHYVVISGRRFPPKQVLAVLTRLDRADFTTIQARRILQRLGFTTGRVSALSRGAPRTEDAESDSRLADALRPHRGRWVAVRGDDVLVAADAPEAVLAWLERYDQRADTMFRVPVDPTVDMGGFPA